MQDTPDLSKIVSLIMQNPSLIEQISALAKSSNDSNSEQTSVPSNPTEDEYIEPTVASAPFSHTPSKARRKELLNAMKPYLSEGRRSAIDSMSSILDILEVMKRKES